MIEVNIAGRTRAEQEAFDTKLEAKGNMWPRIPCYYVFLPIEKYVVYRIMQGLSQVAGEYLEKMRKEIYA